MHTSNRAAGLLALAAGASATYQGFNYASTNGDGSARVTSDWTTYFNTQKNLVGTSGFSSARLYTMIQGGTTADPIQAIEAAIKTNTTLLLGLWTSGTGFANELTALKSAIATYGPSLGNLVAGISIGSEDLYRDSTTGMEADAGVGIGPDQLITYIKEVKDAISGTALSSAKLGHVDTWTAWVNSSNSQVADQLDWIGVDAYPYFQSTMTNPIEDAKSLFDSAMSQVKATVGDKDVWVTETGWPVSGKTYGDAIASTENAATYWQTVGCPLFGSTNTWWYILADEGASPSFGIVSDPTSTTPLFSLTCNTTSSSSSSSDSTGTEGSKATGTISSGSIATGSSNGTSSNSTSSGSGSATNTVSAPTTTLTTASAASASGSSRTGSSSSSSSSNSNSTTPSSSAGGNMATAGTAMVALMVAMFAL